MRNYLTDAHVLTFALAGCNANEIAAYSGTKKSVAVVRMAHVLRKHANMKQNRKRPAGRISKRGVIQ